jgi:hypothetical protein
MDVNLPAHIDDLLRGDAEQFHREIRNALRKTTQEAAQIALKEIEDRYNIGGENPGQIRPDVSNADALETTITASGSPIPLIDLNAVQNARGVQFFVTRAKASFLRGGFIQTMASGHTEVFKRTGFYRVMTSGRYRGRIRETIKTVRTISIAEMFSSRGVIDATESFFDERYAEILENSLN